MIKKISLVVVSLIIAFIFSGCFGDGAKDHSKLELCDSNGYFSDTVSVDDITLEDYLVLGYKEIKNFSASNSNPNEYRLEVFSKDKHLLGNFFYKLIELQDSSKCVSLERKNRAYAQNMVSFIPKKLSKEDRKFIIKYIGYGDLSDIEKIFPLSKDEREMFLRNYSTALDFIENPTIEDYEISFKAFKHDTSFDLNKMPVGIQIKRIERSLYRFKEIKDPLPELQEHLFSLGKYKVGDGWRYTNMEYFLESYEKNMFEISEKIYPYIDKIFEKAKNTKNSSGWFVNPNGYDVFITSNEAIHMYEKIKHIPEFRDRYSKYKHVFK